ncbi:MAG: hypothetical protein ABJO36_12115 [Litorimonas sp.]
MFKSAFVFAFTLTAVSACESSSISSKPPIATDTSASVSIAFEPNDVTILFPAPSSPSDMSQMIRLTDFDSERVLPQDVFDQAMQIATGPTGAVRGSNHRIGFINNPQRQDWVISGIRIDPGAPGVTKDIFDVFGKSPQIRLVAQPVRDTGSGLDVDDISLHLIYAFNAPDQANICNLHNTPDMARFSNAVSDLKAIKDDFATRHSVDTSGPLNVHPAFDVAGTEFKTALRDYLNSHLTRDNLFAVSIAGIPERFEPWIFLAMNNTDNGLQPIPSPATNQPNSDPRLANFSQMLNFRGDTPPVFPSPATRNMAAIDCEMNFGNAVTAQVPGAGTSTASAFTGSGDINEISAVIADASASHFFNTDCVSCHTETRKQIDQMPTRSEKNAMMNQIADNFGIHPAVMPHGDWNVRVMGWAPIDELNNTPGAHATISRRAATETAEVVECFHSEKWNSVTESCLP